MQIRAIAFDLGNTLVEYYHREDYATILADCIRNAHVALSPFATVSLEQAHAIALKENTEQPDGKVRTLQERLDRVFGLTTALPEAIREAACQRFLQPIFNRARKYEDSDSTLQQLRQQGYKLAIVSNTPSGSPSPPWRAEIRRHGIEEFIDVSVFCVEVGWRKPASVIFNHVLQELDVDAAECLFIGDEPVWDFEGARSAGMPALLIDRANRHSSHPGPRIQNLDEVFPLIRHAAARGSS